jgi:uncharacterized protein YkwD
MPTLITIMGGSLLSLLGVAIIVIDSQSPTGNSAIVTDVTQSAKTHSSATPTLSENLDTFGTPTPLASPSPSLSPSPPPPAPPAPQPDKITTAEDEVTRLINIERGKVGCSPVRTDERLRTAARAHSADMAAQNYFDHKGRDGSSFVDRVARAGYPRNSAASENIAYGYRTAADVVKGWMNSDGHRRNILNCASKATGTGLAYRGNTPYWTQNFGRT